MIFINNKSKIYRITIITFCLAVCFEITIAQTNILQKKISIVATHEDLTKVIEKIGQLAEIDFTYNSDIIPQNKKIKISAIDKPVNEILDEILQVYSIQYKVIGNQIVLYKQSNSFYSSENKIKSQKKVEELKPTNEKKQEFTVQTVYDTLITIYYDTLKVQDTIIVYDTIHLETPFISDSNKANFSIGLNGFISYEFIDKIIPIDDNYLSFSELLNNNDKPVFNNAIGADFSINHLKWEFSLGLNYFNFNRKFHYKLLSNELVFNTIYMDSSFYRIDTLDKYCKQYKDTIIWYYILDSSKVVTSVPSQVIDTLESTSDMNNHNKISYIQIPVSIGYNMHLTDDLKLFVKGGLITSILLQSNGFQFSENNIYKTEPINNENLKRYKYSLLFEIGLNYQLIESLAVRSFLTIITDLNSHYNSTIIIQQKFTYIRGGIGIRYFF